MLLFTVLQSGLHAAVAVVPAQIPNPAPAAPPGTAGAAIGQVISIVKWVAGVSLVIGFFGGVAVFAGGRLVDHHRIGRVGTMMMMASVAGAILYAVGYTMITGFAGNG